MSAVAVALALIAIGLCGFALAEVAGQEKQRSREADAFERGKFGLPFICPDTLGEKDLERVIAAHAAGMRAPYPRPADPIRSRQFRPIAWPHPKHSIVCRAKLGPYFWPCSGQWIEITTFADRKPRFRWVWREWRQA